MKMTRYKKWTQEDAINRFREMHGDRYDYSRVKYVDRTTKVIIGCSVHGEFLQSPYGHWRRDGYGCPPCGNEGHKQRDLRRTEFGSV
jgi:hypothetical protein